MQGEEMQLSGGKKDPFIFRKRNVSEASSGRCFLSLSKWIWSPRLPSTARSPELSPGSSAHQAPHCFLPPCPGKGQLCLFFVIFSPCLQQRQAPVLHTNRDAFHLPPSPALTGAWGSPSAKTKDVFWRKSLSVHPWC